MSSFSDKLKELSANNTLTTSVESDIAVMSLEAAPAVMTLALDDELIAAYESWKKPENSARYIYYDDEYYDDKVSTVDGEKNITLASGQINITQEKNSQYIPFQIPRRYDGFDLANTDLSIYWVNETGAGSTAIPVDVYYSTDMIKFAWLIDQNVTAIAGKLQFEIHADGTNSKGFGYTWKTKPCDGLNVLQALEIKTFIEPDETWQETFIDKLSAQADRAEQASSEAVAAANQAKQIVENLQDGLTEEVQQIVNANYYTKDQTQEYVKTQIDAIEIPTVPTNVSEFTNDAGYLTEHQDISGKSDVGHKHSMSDITDYEEPDLTGYATETFVNEEITKVDTKINDAITPIQEDLESIHENIDNLPTTLESDYYTKTVTDELLATKAGKTEFDELSESVKSLPTTLESDYYTKTVTDGLLDDKADKTEFDALAESVENLPTTLETDYYTKTATDGLLALKADNTTVASVESKVNANKTNLDTLSTKVAEIDETVNSIDKSPRLTYDVVYNDAEDPEIGENVFGFYEIQNEGKENEVKELKKKFTIVGGSGGGSASSLKITYVTTSPVITTVNDKVLITYNFTGTDSSGDIVTEGNYTWKIGTKIIATGIATYGENTFDATDFATASSQKFTLSITDDGGSLVTKSWTVQQVDVRLESTFSDVREYNGDVSFNYTPYGAIEKEIHFVLDGKEIGAVTTSSSGIPASYTIPSQKYGSHLLDAYITTTINNTLIKSNHIYKDIIWRDSTNTIPVIGCATPTINITQYNTVNIKYVVIDPNTETPEVTWHLGEEVISVETLTEKDAYGYYTFTYKANEAGTFVFTITCGEAESKTITVNVEELDIDITPVTAGLAFDFNPVGYSNNSSDRLWSYNDVTMTVSDNFDWVNGGYQIDENGDQYFCVKAGTTATINYNLFSDDPKSNGKEFKTIFRTKNIRKRNTSFLTCMNENIGLDMKVEYATLYESGGLLKSNYCEDTIIEYEFNINKYTDMMIVMSYEDGAPNKPYEYTETSSFKQSSPQPITIGSEDCDVLIYRMKAYSMSLTDTDIKNNFIADARNATEMIARYNRNQIYNENSGLVSTSASGDFSADALMKAAPDLRYIFLEVPQFTNDKDNKIDGCTVYFRYPNGTRPQDNWTCTGMRHRGQGTSSNLYGYAGRNIDLCMDRSTSLFTWIDEEGKTVESSTITLTDTSVPTDYLNIKVNIASSENANNAQLARRFNEYQPFLRYARKKDSRVKDTMEFYNCVVFIRETSEDAAVPHREFNDTNWHFYAIGNVGDSKKTDDTRVNDKNDPREHIVEIMDADVDLAKFPTGKDGNAVCPVEEWCEGNTAYDILYSTEYVYDEEGEFESFANESYEFRYEMDGITEEQREANINAWRELYTFIVTSTDEEFYANLKNYFVVDSALYYYLFTERYTMVDNRAKNSFWHYGKVYISTTEATTLGETEASYYIIDDEAAAINDGYRYDLTFGYDMDTALGIDNTGDYVFSYGKEDTDYYVDGDPSSDYVFRVADSVFFCRLRDLFPSEMQAMFKDREDKNAWDSNSLITQWDNAQAQFPEELWRLDYERKYYRTYLGLSIDNSISKGIDKTFLIGKFFGRKKYARRAFEINQEVYFATKYFGKKALTDVFWIRGNIYSGDNDNLKQNYSLTLVPYSDMYVCVKYGSTGTPIHQKVKAGETCYFKNDAERMDFIYIYAASFIQEVGDLSRCYPGDNSFSNATRLQKLVIGSTDDGYNNAFMTEVIVDNNPLLEYLDLRNISGINTVINVSACGNLKELYAEGTNASGAIFANGGLLKIAHLPSVSSLSMKNLNYIEDFTVDTYNNLSKLIVENCPSVNTYNIVVNAPILQFVRLINLNWDSSYRLEDASIFDRLLTIGGVDSSGVVETDQSILTGFAYVVVMKEQQEVNYKNAWSDMDFEYEEFIEQYPVTFVNYDGTVLDVQYVDKGDDAVEPIAAGRISTPTKPSSVSTNYTFAGWDVGFTGIFNSKTVTATYSESVRSYTVQYVSNGIVKQTSTGLYGENVPYTGDIPVRADGDYMYYLFDHWGKSGVVDGDKTINAVFDSCTYSDNYFEGKDISELRPVEIKMLMGMNMEQTYVESMDAISFNMGHDFDYEDVTSKEIISSTMTFNGTNYYDTGIKIMDVDKDFVLAIDYEFGSGNATDATLMHCFSEGTSDGFKLQYNATSSTAQIKWRNEASYQCASGTNREMLVIRHKAGEKDLYVYASNLSGDDVVTTTLSATVRIPITNSTLTFGCSKFSDTSFKNYCIGSVHWAKVWYADLGDVVCKELAEYIHEPIHAEMCGFERNFLSSDLSQTSSMSFLTSHTIDRKMMLNTSSTNTGGWAATSLNAWLNNRFYKGLPLGIKQLIKQVQIKSSIGDKSSIIGESDCYIYIPAIRDLDDSKTGDPYASETYSTIDYMTKDLVVHESDGVTATDYWTRSPNAAGTTSQGYFWYVDSTGKISGYGTANSLKGVIVEFSM